MKKINQYLKKNKKDFLSITDLTKDEILLILHASEKIKTSYSQEQSASLPLHNMSLVMIFEKPSLRTRLSFEIGMTQLGGHAVYLGPQDIGLGKRESIHDVAKVTASMANIIMARTFSHNTIQQLATYAKVPVINALSDIEHPCQTLADLLTIWEQKKKFQSLRICFIGDGDNNVVHSLCLAAALLGMHFSCATPSSYRMLSSIVRQAKHIAKTTGAQIIETDDPKQAITQADVVYTDTWVSMGDEAEKENRLKIFSPYQVTNALMKLAKKDAIFLHDMPAYRGNEVVAEVIDGPQSVIFQQAENRLHAQKGLILFLLGKL